jgi:trehalose 6-phosphate phosphatase
VSGRPSEEVERLLAADGVRYEGCYGLESLAATEEVLGLVRAAASVTKGAWVEPKGASIAVHYREAGDPKSARESLGKGLREIAGWNGLEVIEGKMVLELVPLGASRKGGVVERLVSSAGLRAVLYAGDDSPDLEAFDALDRLRAAGLVTAKIAVSGAETPTELLSAADLVVEGPGGLVEVLKGLAAR